jgi:CRP-like cAMP-binding protein
MRSPALRVECSECQIGLASGIARGQFCPFIERHARAGELVYGEGDAADHVWFLRSGTVVLARGGSNAAPRAGRALAIRFVGSFLGLEALVAPAYLDRATALTDLSLCGATLAGIDAWLGERGSPARTALEMTLRTLSSDRPREARTDGPAVGRLARWLLDEGPRGVTLALPRRVVADLLGMRAETLSRALAELVQRGAIAATRTTLRIVDAGALATAAAQNTGSENTTSGW